MLTDNQKRMLEALYKTKGIVSSAAEIINLTRDSHYKWLKDSKEYAEAYAAVKESVLDWAESKLHDIMQEGNTAAILFYLKTQGKQRGYVERTEVTGANGDAIQFVSNESLKDKVNEL